MIRTALALALLLTACIEPHPDLAVDERASLVCGAFQACIDDGAAEGGTQWCRDSIEANPVSSDCAWAIAEADCADLTDGTLPQECFR